MRDVPHFLQINDYFCGPTILKMVLGAHGKTVTQEEAAGVLGTTVEAGTSAEALVAGMRSNGFEVSGGNHQTLEDIQKALAEDKIVIVCYVELHLQWDHFAVVQNYDSKEIFLNDPAESDVPYRLDIAEFEKRWIGPLFTHTDHWAIYVSKPSYGNSA